MKYNFDREISRKNTQSSKWMKIQADMDSTKWSLTDAYFGENRIISMWVADMDFPCPKPVVDAMVERAKHGIYGYTVRTESYDSAVVNWMKRRHNWAVDPGWICTTPGVVPAIHLLIQTFVKPGEKVLVQQPVYYPFFSAIKNNQAHIVSSALVLKGGRYEMDFSDLEKKTSDPDVKLAILCSPHNPVGRVWSREELERFGDICRRNNVLVVSDEIHCDLIFKGNTFVPFATVNRAFMDNAVICTAPSKTFNLAGLHTSNIIISNPDIRTRFNRTLAACGLLSEINPFGTLAAETAYNEGEDWLEQVMAYIEDNLDFMEAFVKEHLPLFKVIRPQGTYLVWLDCRKLGLDKWGLKKLMLEKARIFLDEGFIFGPEGEGFERINIACPRPLLKEALYRIKAAVDNMAAI